MRAAIGGSTTVRSFSPAVDVRSDDASITFLIDVPGVKLDDLDVEVVDGVLTVRGERRFASGGAGERLLLGRGYGRFERAFRLPDWADADALAAKLEEGVLTVTVPKAERARPRKIRVTNGGETKQLESKD